MAKIRSVEIVNCKLSNNCSRVAIVDINKSKTGRPPKASRHECIVGSTEKIVPLKAAIGIGVTKDDLGNKIARVIISCPEWTCIHNKYRCSF
jgi:hypothetical protein